MVWDFGACDYYWSTLSGYRYALYGGVGFDRTGCGMSNLAVDDPPGNIRWYVGACIVIGCHSTLSLWLMQLVPLDPILMVGLLEALV